MSQVSQCLYLVDRPCWCSPEKDCCWLWPRWVNVCGWLIIQVCVVLRTVVGCDPGESMFAVGWSSGWRLTLESVRLLQDTEYMRGFRGGAAAPLFRRILQKIYEKKHWNEGSSAVFRPPRSRIGVPAPLFLIFWIRPWNRLQKTKPPLRLADSRHIITDLLTCVNTINTICLTDLTVTRKMTFAQVSIYKCW